MPDAEDARFMARAMRLAARGLYDTDPNPTVGCVLAIDGTIVGEGWTAPAGGPHAERAALTAARHGAHGATAYVTLEPCCHHGRTAPCTDALIEAGVARVVCAMLDPNPLVAGRGVEQLRAAGITVEVGTSESAATALNRGFVSRMTRGRPWLRSKIAASLDGRTALANGTSQWITSAAARADGHRWRARSSAILTGVGTVLRDDPRLDARMSAPPWPVRQPARVVVDSGLRTPTAAQLFTRDSPVIIFTTSDDVAAAARLTAAGAQIERVDGGIRCNLESVLRRLAALEINDVWVEAGAQLNGALLAAGLIDELIFYLAPTLLGDAARGMFGLAELASLDEAVRIDIRDVRRIGPDLRIIATPTTVTSAAH